MLIVAFILGMIVGAAVYILIDKYILKKDK